MSARAALARGRRAAERQMIDACVVTRPDKTRPVDERTGKYPMVQVYPDPAWPEEHRLHSGPAKSQTYEGYEQNPEAAGHTYTVQRYAAHFPWDSFVPAVGDVVTWTSCPLSPERVGTVETITAPFDKTLHTALRAFVDRVAEA